MTDLNDNVEKLKRFLQDQGYEPVELENGLQVKWDSGHIIEINALTRDSDYFWASMETTNMDPDKRKMEIASVHEPLSDILFGLATLGSFEQTQDADDRFVYVANVELDPVVAYHGAIRMDDISATERPPSWRDQNHREQKPAVAIKQAVHETVIPEKPSALPEKKTAAEAHTDRISRKTEPAVAAVEMTPATRKPTDPLATAREAVAQLETIDGKMIRQSLDMMNLRRSSNIRLMLTRIFRSAVEPEELMRSIREEAEKIVTDDDRKELDMVRVLSENSFLEPVVSLLLRAVEKKT